MGDCQEVKCIDEDKLQKNILASKDNPPDYVFKKYNCQDWVAEQLSNAKKSKCECQEK